MRDALKARGGEIIAASVNTAQTVADSQRRYADLPCVLAADPGGAVAGELQIVHQNAGTLGKRLAVPVNILIDKNGIVRWAHYARIVMDRADPAEVLEEVNALPSA